MVRGLFAFGTGAAAMLLISCAGGPTYSEMKSKLPAIPKGQGRVFVYRTAGAMGAAVKPSVKIDGVSIGTSEGNGFLYSDQKPGNHEISIATEWVHKNTVNVIAGKPSYVQCMLTPGVFVGHFIPNQVDAAKGESEIQDCRLSNPQ